MEELRVVARESSGPPTCLYCRDAVEAPTVCERCDATYHADCRAELGRCATPGCAGAVRPAPPRPEFAEGWRTTAARAQAEWRETRAEEERRRAAAAPPRTQPRITATTTATPAWATWGAAALTFVALLAVTVHSFVRPGAALDDARLYAPLGVLTGPVVVAIAARALGAPHRAARAGGRAMLVTLALGAGCGVYFDAWWHIPVWLLGAGFAALLAGVAVGGDERVPPPS